MKALALMFWLDSMTLLLIQVEQRGRTLREPYPLLDGVSTLEGCYLREEGSRGSHLGWEIPEWSLAEELIHHLLVGPNIGVSVLRTPEFHVLWYRELTSSEYHPTRSGNTPFRKRPCSTNLVGRGTGPSPDVRRVGSATNIRLGRWIAERRSSCGSRMCLYWRRVGCRGA